MQEGRVIAMNKLNINLENCYGIKKLQKEFDFSDRSAFVIYASNGSMKTSFTKTFFFFITSIAYSPAHGNIENTYSKNKNLKIQFQNSFFDQTTLKAVKSKRTKGGHFLAVAAPNKPISDIDFSYFSKVDFLRFLSIKKS